MKKDKSLNDEQNLAVYSRGSSILVSAPAGSGKTKILVNRMMSLIEDNTCKCRFFTCFNFYESSCFRNETKTRRKFK